MEGITGVLSKGCLVFSGGHSYASKVLDDFKGAHKDPIIHDYPVAYIVQHNQRNFYHFTIESMIRLLYLKDHLLDQNKDIKILVSTTAKTWFLEMAEILHIDKDRYIFYDNYAGQIHYFKNLSLVDWSWKEENDIQKNDASKFFYAPVQGMNRIRQEFLIPSEMAIQKKESLCTIIFISRRDASVRKLKLEEENTIVTMIHQIIKEHQLQDKVEIIYFNAEGKSIKSQIELFKKASIIVGSHGAGFTNMIWSHEQTSIVMFPMKPNSDNCYGYMSVALNMDFWLIPQITSYYYGNYRLDDKGVAAVKEVIEILLKKKNLIMT